jgi:pimeloyl-[acyl-carrier protein] methyl ester esterase
MPVELVFIHGWGFDAHVWDALGERLANYPQTRVNLGFLGANKSPLFSGDGRILIGHSFGFVHGLMQRHNWRGWIAINSFMRFVAAEKKTGCVPPPALRDMRARLQKNPEETLHNFYKMIGATPHLGTPNVERLTAALDELRDADVKDTLEKLGVPGLALAGSEDPLVPDAVSEELGRLAKGGGLLVSQGGNHMLPQARPAWCALAIADFLSKNFGEL